MTTATPADTGAGTSKRPRRAAGLAPLDRDLVVVSEDAPECIPQGFYEAVGESSRLRKMFGGMKLVVRFTVLVPDASGTTRRVKLERYYNIKNAPEGRFRVSRSGDYRREWMIVANRRPSRGDRMSPRIFEGALVEVEVKTVTTDRKQRSLGPHARYSRIARVVELKAGGAPCR